MLILNPSISFDDLHQSLWEEKQFNNGSFTMKKSKEWSGPWEFAQVHQE